MCVIDRWKVSHLSTRRRWNVFPHTSAQRKPPIIQMHTSRKLLLLKRQVTCNMIFKMLKAADYTEICGWSLIFLRKTTTHKWHCRVPKLHCFLYQTQWYRYFVNNSKPSNLVWNMKIRQVSLLSMIVINKRVAVKIFPKLQLRGLIVDCSSTITSSNWTQHEDPVDIFLSATLARKYYLSASHSTGCIII